MDFKTFWRAIALFAKFAEVQDVTVEADLDTIILNGEFREIPDEVREILAELGWEETDAGEWVCEV